MSDELPEGYYKNADYIRVFNKLSEQRHLYEKRIRALESEKAALEARVRELAKMRHEDALAWNDERREYFSRAEKAEADLAAQKNATQEWADAWEDIEAVQTRLTELTAQCECGHLQDRHYFGDELGTACLFWWAVPDGRPERCRCLTFKRAAGRESGGSFGRDDDAKGAPSYSSIPTGTAAKPAARRLSLHPYPGHDEECGT